MLGYGRFILDVKVVRDKTQTQVVKYQPIIENFALTRDVNRTLRLMTGVRR